ncbi:unnamed protein product [Fusarium graminearum]|nr:unnamed protein product [Fusarium graminearum]
MQATDTRVKTAVDLTSYCVPTSDFIQVWFATTVGQLKEWDEAVQVGLRNDQTNQPQGSRLQMAIKGPRFQNIDHAGL